MADCVKEVEGAKAFPCGKCTKTYNSLKRVKSLAMREIFIIIKHALNGQWCIICPDCIPAITNQNDKFYELLWREINCYTVFIEWLKLLKNC